MKWKRKTYTKKKYYDEHNSSLLGDYLKQELELSERIVFENAHFAVVVPFWAIWPYETMIVPKEHLQDIRLLSSAQETSFAEAIACITQLYDGLFQCSFPYSAGIHQAPTNKGDHSHWHFHMSFYPPLLRSATVKKFMVGYEMFGSPQRDITPEQAVAALKALLPT